MISKIENINIEASSACGADCIMCPHRSYEFKNRSMTFELFKKTIDDAVQYGLQLVSFCLIGDGWLDKGLGQKLIYLKKTYPNIKTLISATGHVIDFDLIQYMDVFKISNYGLTKKTYEAVHRGKVKFEDAHRNIERLLALPDRERPYIHMSYVLTPINSHEAEAWKEKWEARVDELFIWKLHNWAGSYKSDETIISPPPPEKSCGRGINGDLSVKVNGLVSMCCFDHTNELIIGDLNKESFCEIFQNSKMLEKIISVHKSNAFKNCGLICEQCDQIRDRSDALVYSSKNRKIGRIASTPDVDMPFVK